MPRPLTAAEMDGVTAGGIRIDAAAFAQASGDLALARTRSDALVSTTNAMEFGIGFAEGLAFACCDPDSAVAVQSSVSTTGQVLHSSTYTTTFRGAIAGDDQVRHFAYGFTAAFLVATSPGASPDAGDQAGRAPWDHLGDSIGTLVDPGQTQTQDRDGVVSGYEFAPVFAAGVRWRLFEGFPGARPTGSLPQGGNLRSSPAPFL